MLSLRCKQLLGGGILALLIAIIIPLPAQASDYGTKDLSLGSQGTAVSQLQTDLTGLGFYTCSIDGWFGSKTHEAVVKFQKSQGLKMDGLVGPITKSALNKATSAVTGTALTLGSRGSAVSQLQTDLTGLGFYSRSIDGWFGSKTHEAVVNFQKAQGLKTDGLVGPITKSALNKATSAVTSPYKSKDSQYNSHEKLIVDSYRASYDGSLAQALVGRAIWYMEYGFMKYGHSKYPTTGYIDCSNFVSLVYKDFGYSITSAAKNYNQVGTKVAGVYSKKMPGSSQYTLVGIEKLKPGDIFTYWNSDAPANTHIGHVAIYMGKVNGKPCIIGTCKGRPTAIGIIDSFSYWYGSALIEVRRVLPNSAYVPGGKINDNGPVIPTKYQINPDQPVIMPDKLPTGF